MASQEDYVVANAAGATVRADINNQLAAIVANNCGTTAPSSTFAYMFWADTAVSPGLLKIRNAGDSAWKTVFDSDGKIRAEDGTALLPSISFKNDIDSGLYSVSGNVLGMAVGGVEVLRTTTGAMTVNNAANNLDFVVSGDANANLLFCDADNNRVGIGYGTLTANFSVWEGAAVSEIHIDTHYANASGSTLSLRHSRHDTIGSHTIVADDDACGTIGFQGSNGTTYDTVARIIGEVDGTPGASTDMPGRLRFLVTPDGSATPAEAIRITQDKKVGISKTVPAELLDVASDTDVSGIIGRAYIGNATGDSDAANFAHYDHFTNTNYSIRHGNAGATRVNAATGATVSIRVNNVNYTAWNGTDVKFEHPVKILATAADVADEASYGQLWVDSSDGLLKFTTGAGVAYTVDLTAV